ncbi:hypothetical protein [Streptomyces sp. NBC_00568]|uniref:hypothetical protein n=1 Tax=Streptomyces sp. NBC_00568 TaxID=2975779 RepID=UPI0022540F37|nr:hypothetical protein [Streptomyces sp. NBC_00568]MCX4993712.1 hypothetical protein [Streptomyces sp. NBC_00568]
MSITDTLKMLKQIGTQTGQHLGLIGTLILVVFLLLYVGVVLPSVWSRHSYRRAAARRTMTTLLDYMNKLKPTLPFRPRR